MAIRDVVLAVTRFGYAALSVALGCATAEASRESDPKSIGSAVEALVVEGEPSSTDKDKVDADDAALRRAYVASEMKVHPCAVAKEDGTIVGENCPSALVVFGPYVSVPANSDVQLRFDIESPTRLRLSSDVLSESAKRFHGALDEQVIEPNQVRTVSYRIHVFDAARALETRVGIRSDLPSNFTITNLKVSIL